MSEKVVQMFGPRGHDDTISALEAEWNRFYLACGLAAASEIQQTEMRRAFFSGAMSALLVGARLGEIEPVRVDRLFREAEAVIREIIDAERSGTEPSTNGGSDE